MGAGMIATGKVQIAHELLHDQKLLIVLLAENRDIGQCLQEKLGDNGGYAEKKCGREMPSSVCATPATSTRVAKSSG